MKTITVGMMLIAVVGCTRNDDPRLAKPGRPMTSPSSKYVLKVNENKKHGAIYQYFVVETPAGAGVFQCRDGFSKRHTVFFAWDKDDRVWVYDGDASTFYWERGDTQDWAKKAYHGPPPEPPAVFKELRPKRFP